MTMKNKPLTFGIIGAGVALVVVIGVLVVLPLVTRAPPVAPPPIAPLEQQQQQDPERQRILETPNTGQPGQPIIKHQELRAQDPLFDRYMLVQEECFNNLENNVDPNVAGCRQAFEDGQALWCSISSPQYNQVKCKEVNDNAPVFDEWLRLNAAEKGLNQ